MVDAAADAQLGAPFLPERAADDHAVDEQRLRLSDRVRREELFAFVEIPASPEREQLRYYSDHPAYDELRLWLARTVDDELRAERFAAEKLSPELAAALSHHVGAESLGLVSRGPDGLVHAAERQDAVKAVVVPMVPVFLLFLFVVMSAPQLMHSVLTEKLSRISEVLLGSLTPFELMAGKLLGAVAVSLLLGALYLAGGISVAARMGLGAAVTPSLVAWFLGFLVLAMLLYGSVTLAVGAACSDVKDAQNLMLPIMLPLMVPLFATAAVVQSPSSALAVGLSLFPPSTPLIMLLRVGLHPAPPWWQVALGVLGALATTVACVWAAGRIFRVGLLAQGKSAGVGQMLRWVLMR
jgi:ABC-type Na+ efflux pump permease subunit